MTSRYYSGSYDYLSDYMMDAVLDELGVLFGVEKKKKGKSKNTYSSYKPNG